MIFRIFTPFILFVSWLVSWFVSGPVLRLFSGSFFAFWVFSASWVLCSCKPKSSLEQPVLASVFVRKVQAEQIADILTYPARVRAKINATVLSENEGIISQVLVTLGQRVQAQQTLMVLKHTDPVYQYAPVQIPAPISGIVSAVDVTVGSHVLQGQKLAAVINPSQLEIQVEIPAQDLATIHQGMMGEFKLPGQEALLNIRVLGVSPFVDPNTGTALAQLDIIHRTHALLSPGMQGQVTFKANSHLGFLIPDTAVIYKGKETYIRVIENKKVKQIAAVLGSKQRGSVEVLKGLYSGAELVERSSRFVAEGEAVNVENSL